MPDTKQAVVIFSPSGKRGRFDIGTSILQAARELGVDLDSICAGRTQCGRCQVELIEGSFAKEGITSRHRHLSEKSGDEFTCEQNGQLNTAYRLAC